MLLVIKEMIAICLLAGLAVTLIPAIVELDQIVRRLRERKNGRRISEKHP